MNVLSLGCHGSELLLLLLLLLELGSLLSLHGWCRDLHTQDDVTNFASRQAGDVDVVLLAVVVENQVSELRLNLDPVLVGQGRPDMVVLRDDRLVWSQNKLRLVRIHLQGSKN